MLKQPVTHLVYCIIENGIPDTFTRLSDAQEPVSRIRYKDIAVVIREVDARIAEELNFDETTLDQPLKTADFEERLKNWLAEYQQTNIDIFRHYTMLPLRFGTMVDHKAGVKRFLASNYMHIKWALQKLKGKAEFVVQLSWDLKAILQEISQSKQWLDKARESIDLANKIEVGRLLFETADKKKKEIVDSVHRKLSAVSLDSSDGKYTDGLVIMNRSYLIDKTEERLFDEAMTELGRDNESYLSFKYIGPIPPYSFVPLKFERGSFELIDEARKILLLPERASFEEIKASYRKLSLKYHPDKNPSDQQSSERFKRIDEACKLLELYCYSCGMGIGSRKKKYSFAKKDVEETFIVNRK